MLDSALSNLTPKAKTKANVDLPVCTGYLAKDHEANSGPVDQYNCNLNIAVIYVRTQVIYSQFSTVVLGIKLAYLLNYRVISEELDREVRKVFAVDQSYQGEPS